MDRVLNLTFCDIVKDPAVISWVSEYRETDRDPLVLGPHPWHDELEWTPVELAGRQIEHLLFTI